MITTELTIEQLNLMITNYSRGSYSYRETKLKTNEETKKQSYGGTKLESREQSYGKTKL